MELSKELAHFRDMDQKLASITGDIRILGNLSWPASIQETFLEAWDKGKPQLPLIQHPVFQYRDQIKALETYMGELDISHPIGAYLSDTAQSYLDACLMLQNLGTAHMTTHSISLYGKPRDTLHGSHQTNLDAAYFFVDAAREFAEHVGEESNDYCITAQAVREDLQNAVGAFFTQHKIPVVIDENLASKATAGTNRIRIRGGTCFSKFDIAQLLQHEALVHTLTGINGSAQPHLTMLGRGSPRTTATQEGIATFAELVTGAMDIARLKRIAMRIIAVDMALNGADFLDVFRFFFEEGQGRLESFNSAMRVFRGGDVRGRICFTKDNVYLSGLITTHSFFRWAMRESKFHLKRYLFAGRLTFSDVFRLEPFFANDFIREPVYLPPWLQNAPTLAGFLTFSLFAEKIRMKSINFGEPTMT